MKHIIDIDTWEHRDNYGFFRIYLNSWRSVITRIDCTEAGAVARRSGHSFFLYYLYVVPRSANEVNELRYRIDKNGQVILHDRIDITSPITVLGKTSYTVRIPYHENFEHFYAEAHALTMDISEDGGPYHAEKELMQQGGCDVAHLSAVPKTSFTFITYIVAETGNGYSHPLIIVGKVVFHGERLVFPLSIYVNHVSMNGSHLASLFGKIEKYLKEVQYYRIIIELISNFVRVKLDVR